MSLKKLALALAIAMVMSVGAFAAETTVSGVMYAKYELNNLADYEDGQSYSGGYNEGFLVDRVFVTFKSKIDDVWSVKVTVDAADTGAKNNMYLYNAFAKAQITPWMSLSFGLVGMPEYTLIHGINGLRWLDKPLPDRLSTIADFTSTGGTAMKFGNASADLGGRIDLKFADMIFAAVSFTTFDGLTELDEADLDKAINVAIWAKLIKSLYVGAYAKFVLDPAIEDYGQFGKNLMFIGATVAWSDQYYKAGLNWMLKDFGDYAPATAFAAGLAANDMAEEAGIYNVFEVYANINLAGAIQIPILVIARATLQLNQYLSDVSMLGAGETDAGSGLAGFGLDIGVGYKFNKNVQVALLYSGNMTKEVGDNVDTLVSDISLNAEVKF